MSWGPFAAGLDPDERACRFRAVGAMVQVLGRPWAEGIIPLLAIAESSAGAIGAAMTAIEALPTVPYRRVLASYAAFEKLRLGR